MSGTAFWLALVGLSLLMVAFPLYQMLFRQGPWLYSNGLDEAIYLQYDYSKIIQSPSRFSSYLVTLGHHLGLSGAAQNFLFDVVTFPVVLLFLRGAMTARGVARNKAGWAVLVVVLTPSLFLYVNPVFSHLESWLFQTKLLAWIASPGVDYLPFMRTPEPQFSLMLLAVAAWACARWRSTLPLYAVVPVLYNFLSFPILFVVLGCDLARRVPALRQRPWAAMGVSWLAVGGMAWVLTALLLADKYSDYVIASRLPLVTVTGVISLGVYFLVRRWIVDRYQPLALGIALSAWVGINQHVFTGLLAQPVNFEEYYGVFCPGALLALAMASRDTWTVPAKGMVVAVVMTAAFLSLVSLRNWFHFNDRHINQLVYDQALYDALRDDTPRVMVNDMELAAHLSLLYPRQAMTPMHYAAINAFQGISTRHFPRYQCLKQQVNQDPAYRQQFSLAFSRLDALYRFGARDNPHVHIYRRPDVTQVIDPQQEATDCPAGLMPIVYLTDPAVPKVKDRLRGVLKP